MPAPADNRSNQYAKVARDVVEVPPPDAGHIIRVFRLRVGLTLEGLAQALGISFSTVSRWENGHMKPSRLAWQALAQLAAENGRPLQGGREGNGKRLRRAELLRPLPASPAQSLAHVSTTGPLPTVATGVGPSRRDLPYALRS